MNWFFEGLLILCLICRLFIPTISAVNPDRELTHDNTTYSVFIQDMTTGNYISWTDAQDICVSWGGNLATIKSEQIDTLLFYLTDIITHSDSWIGLNDMSNEAGTDASRFVWVDGSDSTYRQFATSPEAEAYPRATSGNWDCVSFRYNRRPNFNTISNGWHDRPCGSTVFSYFCSKPGTSNGCDLIYEDYCYQTFTVSVGIDWNDAQSTCAAWGGDLTSIPTQRVNNFIQTVLPDTNSEYWIGLYEENGNLKWIDGSTSSYTNMISSTGSSCVTMDTDGNWLRNECDSLLNNFICRRNSNYIEEYEMTRELTFEDTTFAIFTTFPRVSWSAARDNCINWGGNLATIKSSQQDTLLYNLADIDVYYASWIGLNDRDIEAGDMPNEFVWVDGSDSNYRQFAINPFSYPSGVTVESDCVSFRYKYLTVLSDGWYDRECDGAVFSYYCQKAGISNGCDLIYEDSCYRAFETIDRINWNDAQSTCAVWGGDLTSISSQRVNDFMQTLRSNTNSEYWIGLFGDVDENFFWNDGTTSNYRKFRSNGVSNFNSASCVIMETDGEWRNSDCADEIGGFICNRSPSYDTGYTAPNTISTSIHGIVQNGSVLFFDEDVITMNCTISNPTYTVEWYYRTLTDGNVTDVTSLSVFSPQTGISSLDINSHELGYYDCIINRYSVYSVFLTHSSFLVTITSFNNPSQQMDYTVDSTSILFYSQSDVPDNSLRWTTDTVSNGDNQQYSIEYTNPVDLNVVFSDTGAGVQRLSCFYRMSPVTLLGSLQVAIRDYAMLTISYEGYSNTFNDITNSMFPFPQMISILENTTNVTLSCSQCLMIQSVIQDVLTNITNLPYVISVFSEDNAGSYMLLRETPSGIQYTTAHVYVSFTPNIFTTSTISPSMTIIYIVVPVCVIVAFILLLVMMIIIFCLVKYRKKNAGSMKGASEGQKDNTIRSQRLEDTSDELISHNERKEYIFLDEIQNREYMTIDETSIIPVETQNLSDQAEYRFYSNQAPIKHKLKPNSTQIHIQSTGNQANSVNFLSNDEYLPMSPSTIVDVVTNVPISSRDFLTTYKRIIKAGTERGSNFFREFSTLNKETEQFGHSDSKSTQHSVNLVVLESQYFQCNQINAGWLENFEYITSVHPNVHTQKTFLQMIYQTKASMVIMLTARKEKAKIISGSSNHVCYWPMNDEPFMCGPFESSMISCTEMSAFVRQEISLKNTCEGKEHSYIHCLSPIWNEDCTVSDMTWVATLLIKIIKQKQDSPNLPIIIHCEDGISKTGIIMTALTSVKQLNKTSTIDIFNTVKNLRRQRMGMIPTMACYTTCYSLMNEYCSIHF